MELSVAYQYKGGDVSPQVQHRMDLHGSPGIFSRGPAEKRKAQRNGGGIQCEDLVVQSDTGGRAIRVHGPHQADKVLPEVGEYSPIPALVGTRERGSVDVPAETKVIELVPMCLETGRDVPKGIPGGELSEEQLHELVPTIEITGAVIPVVPFDAFIELVPVYILKESGKDIFSGIHDGHFKGPPRYRQKSNQEIKERIQTPTFKGFERNF